ncbi:hypothetical protein TCAL_04381 [Tigriopus californicus]|uniref:Cysteine protease n=1 Tax=Tigriopus californicus TaxID=6832 RepID=A0A553NPS6_TIGCA|nr:cysteine protease ATG4B-like [Tigriopus californicus]TRY67417.1 hypothetical protein TCAL_04381 [Tigriopus californicus]
MEDLIEAGVSLYQNFLRRDASESTSHPSKDANLDPADPAHGVEPDEAGFPVTESPIWILGQDYVNSGSAPDVGLLRRRLSSLLWFSYRSGFPEIASSGFTSDRGWGCMLRCGQMMLAEALIRLHLGSKWRWEVDTTDEQYLDILKLFQDLPSAPYGIHKIALMGESTERKPIGTWFGPNTVAQVLKKLAAFDQKDHMKLHIALDNMVVIDEIKALAQSGSEALWNPLTLVIPLRLGLTEVNPVYFQDLKETFELPQCIGVMGGRPNHALYFIGYADDEVLCLDPHQTQVSGSVGTKSNEDEVTLDSSYHQRKVSRLAIDQLDPSLALCFFCSSETEFDDLCQGIRQRLIHCRSTPLFELCRQRPAALRTATALEASTTFKFHSRDNSTPEASRDVGSPTSSDGSDEEEDFEIL